MYSDQPRGPGIAPMDALVLLGGFSVLCALGVPVAYALGLAALIAALWIDIPLEAVMLKISDGTDDFALLAIPFFVLAGAHHGRGRHGARGWSTSPRCSSASSAAAWRWSTSSPSTLLRLHLGLVGRRHRLDRLGDDPADGEAGLPARLRHQRHHLRLGAGAADSALAQRGDLLARRRRHDLGRAPVPRRRVPGLLFGAVPDRPGAVDRAQAQHAQVASRCRCKDIPKIVLEALWGLVTIVHHPGRHPVGRVHRRPSRPRSRASTRSSSRSSSTATTSGATCRTSCIAW